MLREIPSLIGIKALPLMGGGQITDHLRKGSDSRITLIAASGEA